MTLTGEHRAVSLLPPLATTGIGSLPHTQLELGLQMAFQVEIPYLPQLPAGNPAELMIPQALEGLPGLCADAEGMCTVNVSDWERERDRFGESIEKALSSGEVAAFEPTPQASRAFRPFLWEVEHRKLALAKVQLAGPATVRWVTRLQDGRPASEVAALDQQIFRLLLVKSLALVKAVRRSGATPILFLDEPGLFQLQARNPRHFVVLQELKVLVQALQKEGAMVAVHCCGNTDWAALFGLGLDLVSVDARLSLDAVLEDREAFLRFLYTGATLSLGIIPTDLSSAYDVEVLVESIEASLRATLKSEEAFQSVLARCLLTPACGLAMRSVGEAGRIFDEVRLAQRKLKELAAL